MEQLYITDKAKYNGQDMDWTEYQTGRVLLRKGAKLYHASEEKLIAFYPKTTCFFIDRCSDGYIYCFILKKDIIVPKYGGEVRINLKKYNNNYFDIFYAGTAEVIFYSYNPKYPQWQKFRIETDLLQQFQIDENYQFEYV